MNRSNNRYNGIAIGFHWLIAVLIIGLLGVGKYMVSLDESEPLRYVLTQWHKSFGIVALVLIFLRLVWRVAHRPPPMPGYLSSWEIKAAVLAHGLLYLLIVVIPLSGWIMVSASPLELPTLLFDGIRWPHLAPFDSLPGKADISALFAEIHELAGSMLILLLLAHIGAALRHRFVLHDGVMSRMAPKTRDGRWAPGIVPLTATVVIIVAGLIAHGYSGRDTAPLGAGDSRVSFTFTVQDQSAEASFAESTVELSLDAGNPAASTLDASVNTASVSAGNSQVDATLVASDWFDVKNHPLASFTSDAIEPVGENSYRVSGTLTIRGVSRELTFPLNLVLEENRRVASGSFTLDRLDFDLGRSSQPDDDTVAYPVEVGFEFEVQ